MNCLEHPSAPHKGFHYNKPLEYYIGQYEARVLQESPSRFIGPITSRALWKFFSRFPKRKRPQDFWVTDAEDYKRIRLEQGAAWNSVRSELGYIRGFFRFVITEFDVEMENPVIPLSARRRPKSVEEALWLLEEDRSERLK